jgi:5-methylcytosine-specific restriction endonuclease McrA
MPWRVESGAIDGVGYCHWRLMFDNRLAHWCHHWVEAQMISKSCAYPGCYRSIPDDGPGRCANHIQQNVDPLARRDAGRDPFYLTSQWRRLRAAVLADRPICEECKRRAAVAVDHIVSRRLGGPDVWDNLRSLCHGCHSRKTAMVDQREYRRIALESERTFLPGIGWVEPR